MRRLLTLAAALPMLAFSSGVRAELAEDYMAACLAATQNNETLCACKTERAAAQDEEMLGFLVAQIRSPAAFNAAVAEGRVPEEIMKRWPYHVRDTVKACTTT